MAKEYIPREDVINDIGELFTICRETLPNECGHHFIVESELQSHLDFVRNLPAADVVEVVQCRECRHAAPNGLDIKCNKHSGSTKSKLGGEISYIELHKPHFFCADGKRMGGGQDDV